MLRTERYTYVRSIRGPWLLYDNQRDPFQMQSLCRKAENKELQLRLDRWTGNYGGAQPTSCRCGIGQRRHPSPWGDSNSTLAAVSGEHR